VAPLLRQPCATTTELSGACSRAHAEDRFALHHAVREAVVGAPSFAAGIRRLRKFIPAFPAWKTVTIPKGTAQWLAGFRRGRSP
jgi:hypothetical protein